MFLACLLRRKQFMPVPEPGPGPCIPRTEVAGPEPKKEESGSAKPATPLRIRIPSGVQCSSCEDFKVLQVVNKTPSPWCCGSCS